MKKNYLNKEVEKIIKEVKELEVIAFSEVLQEKDDEPITECVEVTIGVYVYNAGENLFIIQDLYKDSIVKCNTSYLKSYLEDVLGKKYLNSYLKNIMREKGR